VCTVVAVITSPISFFFRNLRVWCQPLVYQFFFFLLSAPLRSVY
jgi:hypothetical protein